MNQLVEIRRDIIPKNCTQEQVKIALNILIVKPHAIDKKGIVGAILSPKSDFSSQLKEEVYFEQDFLIWRKLIPKSMKSKCQCKVQKLCFINKFQDGPLNFQLKVSMENEDQVFEISFHDEFATLSKSSNLSDKNFAVSSFDHLLKWCSEENLISGPKSLTLVSLDTYQIKYNQLKEKYSRQIIENWGESTDPEKFVHEDIAIATYLILIWSEELEESPSRKFKFLDLGCGNGLLVFILTKEGFRGTGLDLRKRKIWDTFGEDVDLRVETISPENNMIYSDYEWLIGNHSDELTPWIPVMSGLTSVEDDVNCKFFVLPCCPFEFKSKFRRRNQKISLYRDYLDYVKQVGETCGFVMEEDRLKIPSTKRICFIGRKTQTCAKIERKSKILEMISTKQDSSSSPERKKTRLQELKFVPRSSVIKVRNCTQVDKKVTQNIIDVVVNSCLQAKNPLKMVTRERWLIKNSNPEWNRGSNLALNQVAALFEPPMLQKLKNECGGLQTLFRNHNFIFIVEKGCVRLRCHALDLHSAGKKKVNVKTQKLLKRKLCWFHLNHPDGCPVHKEDCSWAHGDEDLITDSSR